jgi:cytochrome c oxidase subunit II
MLSGSSPFSDYVDSTFLAVMGVTLIVFIGIIIAMIVFTIRYNRKKNLKPSNVDGNIPLEVTWTVIPLIIFLGMFYLGWRGYIAEHTVPDNVFPVKVTAQMWKWTFEYPNGIREDTLYVPMNVPVKCTIVSIDVNHSFFIPAFRIKKDAIPNRENIMWFKTVRKASYDIACAEYCGLQHSYMYSKVVSMDSIDFERWYQDETIKQKKVYSRLADIIR